MLFRSCVRDRSQSAPPAPKAIILTPPLESDDKTQEIYGSDTESDDTLPSVEAIAASIAVVTPPRADRPPISTPPLTTPSDLQFAIDEDEESQEVSPTGSVAPMDVSVAFSPSTPTFAQFLIDQRFQEHVQRPWPETWFLNDISLVPKDTNPSSDTLNAMTEGDRTNASWKGAGHQTYTEKDECLQSEIEKDMQDSDERPRKRRMLVNYRQ